MVGVTVLSGRSLGGAIIQVDVIACPDLRALSIVKFEVLASVDVFLEGSVLVWRVVRPVSVVEAVVALRLQGLVVLHIHVAIAWLHHGQDLGEALSVL